MELKMEVYDAALTLLGILETYDAVIIDDRAFQPGSFSLESIADSITVPLLRPGHIIWLEGETAGVIECVQAARSGAGQTLSVRGCLLAGLLGRRILWGMYNLSGSPPQLMYDMVQDCAITPTRGDAAQRVIPNLMLDGTPPADARTVRKQSTGASLTSFLTELAQANQVAYGVRFDPAVPQMAFWARVGVDRTVEQFAVDPVLLSTELDDVLSAEYAYDESTFRNVALVAGEGEGADRKTEIVTNSACPGVVVPSGYTRLEYIESTGTQYIDTGCRPTALTRVVIDMHSTSSPAVGTLIFGSIGPGGAQATLTYNVYMMVSPTAIRTDYFGNMVFGAITNNLQRMVIDKDKNVTKVQGFEFVSPEVESEMACPGNLFIFALNHDGTPMLYCSYKLYSFAMYDDGVLLRSYVPCQRADGAVGLYDEVSGQFFGNAGTGAFVAGPEVPWYKPTGMMLRETFVDARDLQSAADPDAPLTDEEYQAALNTRGQEALADAPLVQSFSASVRTRDATYRYGEDFLLGDTITVTDERLGISVSAVVEGVERSVGRTGEDMVLTLGYGLPTLSDRLRKAGV